MNNLKDQVEFIQKKAELLASRYMSGQDYDDLLQEGILVGLELLDKGVEDEKKLVGAMRRRMNDYKNYENRSVPVPSTGGTRKAMAAISRSGAATTAKGDLSHTVEWPLLQALTQSYGVSLEDCHLEATQDQATSYEEQDYLQHIMFILEETLDTRTYDVVMSVYIHGLTQEEVADQLGVTQQRVAQILEFGLLKVKQVLEE